MNTSENGVCVPAQVFAEAAGRCRMVCTADFLPNELAPAIQAMIEQGILAMKRTLEAASNDA